MENLPDNLTAEVKQTGWLPDDKIGEGGGGTTFLCYKTAMIASLEDFMKLSGPTVRTPGQSEKMCKFLVKTFLENMVWSQDGLAVVKTPHSIKGKEGLERLHKEITAMASFNHPGLIKLITYDSKVPPQWFLMEYHPHGTLAKQVVKYKGRLLHILTAIRPVIDGVAQLHKAKYVHRDIKPNNIFIAQDGRLVLGDFGIIFTKEDDRTRLTKPGDSLFSHDWIPDWVRFREAEDFKFKVDVFMLAKVIYYMMSGENVLDSQINDVDKDLTRLYSGVKGVELIHDLLKKCITGREDDCQVADAGALLKGIDDLIDWITSYPDKAALILKWRNDNITIIRKGIPLQDECRIENCTPFWVKLHDGSGKYYSESLDDVKLAQDVTRNDRLKLIVS